MNNMIDQFGRNIDYLRISVTDRCNLRCIYCMPEDGVKLVEQKELLSVEEIARVCSVMASLGIKKIKLTGGEPLVRHGVAELVKRLKKIDGIEKVTLTTNGVFLESQIQGLVEAGLDALNISLDTLDKKCYERITRSDKLEQTLNGIQAALRFPGLSVKINCVPLGFEEQNLCQVAALAQRYPVHVRFIEMMPIGQGKAFQGMTEEQVISVLQKEFGPLVCYTGNRLGNGPSHYYAVEGFLGKIGFISAVSHKFCGECNRIRMTSQGYLKTCLQYTAGRDLKCIIRNGGSDEELRREILAALDDKPIGHTFLQKNKRDDTECLCMSQIGG